jgi:hypothetical protein
MPAHDLERRDAAEVDAGVELQQADELAPMDGVFEREGAFFAGGGVPEVVPAVLAFDFDTWQAGHGFPFLNNARSNVNYEYLHLISIYIESDRPSSKIPIDNHCPLMFLTSYIYIHRVGSAVQQNPHR